jgi:uncharacterized membrane protein YgcG
MRALLLSLLIWPLAAQPSPNPAVSGEWVADEAAMLSDSDHSRLRALLQRIHRRTDAQVVVLTVPRITGMGSRDYATKRFNEWRLGSAEKNDGVLVLLARQERFIEIVTGSGLTKSLPPATLADIIRLRMVPTLRDGQPADALANGLKDIAAQLANFPRATPIPTAFLAALALLGGALGIAATVLLWRFRTRPLLLPPTGRVPAVRIYEGDDYSLNKFRDDKPETFYRYQGARPDGQSDSYPAHLLWGAALGLALAAAGLAGLAVAAMNPDLEPSFWQLSIALGLLCPLALLALGPVNTGDFAASSVVAALTVAVGGAIPASAATKYLFSDYALATYLAPAAVALVNLATGYMIIRGFYGWTPQRFACQSCRGPIRPLTAEETTAALPPWGKQAAQSALVRFRGWRCATKCPGEYIAFAAASKDAMCEKCKTPTRVQSTKGGYRVRTCQLCGAAERTKLPKPGTSSGGAYYADSYEAPATASSSNDSYQQDQWQRYDDSPSTSSGGSTDGDGASGNW